MILTKKCPALEGECVKVRFELGRCSYLYNAVVVAKTMDGTCSFELVDRIQVLPIL